MENKKLTVEEMHRLTVDEFKRAPTQPLAVVLDNVRSLHNVGSVFRTADAFRIEKIVLCGITACPPSAEIHKTALGAEDAVAWEYAADTLQAILTLKEAGYETLAVEQAENSHKLGAFVFEKEKKYALVLGNEVKGVRQDVVDACGGVIDIPHDGNKHSLNVSVTAGIVMWEASKQMST